MNIQQYGELAQIMPFNTVIEDIFTVKEGIREASLAPLTQVSIRADKILTEIIKNLFETRLVSLLWENLLEVLREGKIEEKALRRFEAQKRRAQEYSKEIGEILLDILPKRAFHSYTRKIGLDYIIDVAPIIGPSVEGCGVTLYSLQDFLNQIGKEENREIIHALSTTFPAIQLIFFDKRNEKEVKEKYNEILEVRNKKLDSIQGVFATKDSIHYSLLETALLGELIGYLPCCVGTYVELKRRARLSELQRSSKRYTPPESYVTYQGWFGLYEFLGEELLKDGFKSGKIIDLIKDEMPAQFYSKPFDNFYSCSIGCFNAIRMGKQIEKQAEKIDPKLAMTYRIGLVGRFLSPMIGELRLEEKYKIPFEEVFRIFPGEEEYKDKLSSEIRKVKSYSGLKFFQKFEESAAYDDISLRSLIKKPYNRIENYIALLQHHFFFSKDIEKLDVSPEVSSIYEGIYSPY